MASSGPSQSRLKLKAARLWATISKVLPVPHVQQPPANHRHTDSSRLGQEGLHPWVWCAVAAAPLNIIARCSLLLAPGFLCCGGASTLTTQQSIHCCSFFRPKSCLDHIHRINTIHPLEHPRHPTPRRRETHGLHAAFSFLSYISRKSKPDQVPAAASTTSPTPSSAPPPDAFLGTTREPPSTKHNIPDCR